MPARSVLLVEDNDDNLRIYSTILTHFGYAVIEAVDGEAALTAAHQHHPEMILMDISIPKLDGWEVTRRLKAHPETAGIPIVALSAHALPVDRERSVAAGCDGHISKPAEPWTVLAEVRRRLGTPAIT